MLNQCHDCQNLFDLSKYGQVEKSEKISISRVFRIFGFQIERSDKFPILPIFGKVGNDEKVKTETSEKLEMLPICKNIIKKRKAKLRKARNSREIGNALRS